LIGHEAQHQPTVALDCAPFDVQLIRAPKACERAGQVTAPSYVRAFLLDHDRVPFVVHELLAPTSQHQGVPNLGQFAASQEALQQTFQQLLDDFDT
jgi:hypothetical protein